LRDVGNTTEFIEQMSWFILSITNDFLIVDVEHERIAINEANKLGIPVIGIVDTNSNPDGIDYVIPANDDALRAIEIYVSAMADACASGKDDGTSVAGEFVEVAEEVVVAAEQV
jgi:small subunit ribosomal protein S2